MAFDFAWNAQKNKMSDIKGKENEQERKGEIKNDKIDLTRTHLNYDFVESDLNLYQRAKVRVDQLKSEKKRVQANSVITYSNIITIPATEAVKMTDEEKTKYFKTNYEYFCDRFGKENVLSAKVHLDETAPHMHLHFMPINKENGRLQARIVMNKEAIKEIHDELPQRLREQGFEVQRASGEKTKLKLDIHEYKANQDLKRENMQLLKKSMVLESTVDTTKRLAEEVEVKYDATSSKLQRETEKLESLTQEVQQLESRKQSYEQSLKNGVNTLRSLLYEVSSKENEIEKLGNVHEDLKRLQTEVQQYQKQIQEQIHSLSDLRLKESFADSATPQKLSRNLSISPESYKVLKEQAELSVKLQRALKTSEEEKNRLVRDNEYLKSQDRRIPGLLDENRKLSKQLEFFKQLFEKLRNALTRQKIIEPDRFDGITGAAKAQVTLEQGVKTEPEFRNEKEKVNFEAYRDHFKEQRKEISLDLER